MTLNFIVNHQLLTLNPAQKNITIAADSCNYLKAKFIYQTQEWINGKMHYALFTYKDKTYKKYLGLEEGVQANECYIPPEVIKNGNFMVSLFCDDLITTTVVVVPVKASGYTDDITNQETPSVNEQLEKMCREKINSIIDDYIEENEFIISAEEIE